MVADLLSDNRTLLHKSLTYLETVQQPIVDQRDQYNDLIQRFPPALNQLGRAIGVYGDWVNFYVCDITLMENGLQPGGPVRTVKIWGQPTGRCTPQ